MPRTFIALDLETTGLNPDRDAIIEVGAVKFRDGVPVERFATLVDPGRPIPYDIQQITGISNKDIIGKPRFDSIAGQIMRFVGQFPVVGHNVRFDLGFMHAQNLLAESLGLDTWELATILLPNQPGYSLGALVGHYELRLDQHHRALDDAEATGHLFLRLCEEAARLPRAVLMEINRLARSSDWSLALVFREAGASGGVARKSAQPLPVEQLLTDRSEPGPLRALEPVTSREDPAPIDIAELSALLTPDGAIGRTFPGYEFRPPQLAMLETVAQAFNDGHHLLVEAGTGTGKSLAYLLPAIAYAMKNGRRVVVSTNTINLQDQLFNKDLPDLQRICGQANGGTSQPSFRAALLKGRSNYLCPRRFAALKARPNLSQDELRGIARILVWLPTTRTGDRSELSLPLQSDRFVWSQVSAENEGCSLDRCQREMGGRCFFYRAHRLAEAAHILVVNHALLMADAATENRVLPEYHHLIIDEAHHLEAAVTDQLSFRAGNGSINQLLNALYAVSGRGRSHQVSGLLAELQACVQSRLPDALWQVMRDHIIRAQGDTETVRTRVGDFWDVIDDVINGLQPNAAKSSYDIRLRITDSVRSQPPWVEVEVSWENVGLTWQTLLKRLDRLQGAIKDLGDGGFKSKCLGSVAEDLATTARQLAEFNAQMEAWVMRPDPNGVYWAEIGKARFGAQRITLRSAPLHIGPLVQEHILFRNDTVILTSATLRTAGSFEYLRDRLYAQDADTATVGSPFDYQKSTLLYLPTDLPEPNAPGYQNAVETALIGLARALGGRTLALFTSYAQLRRTAQAITPALTEAGIKVMSQGSGGSRHQLLQTFKTDANSVLLGTRSFWEGVDVVGPALSALALVRLPFAVPSDPIVAARSETFDDPFYNYSVPDAILRFRQGFGRLIRSKSDRGVVVVLDKRVQSKNYGQLFLESLPECTVQRAPLMNLASAARQWVDGNQSSI